MSITVKMQDGDEVVMRLHEAHLAPSPDWPREMRTAMRGTVCGDARGPRDLRCLYASSSAFDDLVAAGCEVRHNALLGDYLRPPNPHPLWLFTQVSRQIITIARFDP